MYLFDEPQRRRKSFPPELKKEIFKGQAGKWHVLRQEARDRPDGHRPQEPNGQRRIGPEA